MKAYQVAAFFVLGAISACSTSSLWGPFAEPNAAYCDADSPASVCSDGTRCDTAAKKCRYFNPDLGSFGCKDSSECSASPEKPLCDPGTQACNRCDKVANADALCKGLNTVTHADWCIAATGHCGQCRNDGDCNPTSNTPLCDTSTNTCRGCQTDTECKDSHLCGTAHPDLQDLGSVYPALQNLSGKCVPVGEVAYVDTSAGNCTMATGDSLKPYCNIQDSLATTKGVISVRPTAAGQEDKTAILAQVSRPKVIIGPGVGSEVTTTATVLGGVRVDGSSDLRFEGIVFSAASVRCISDQASLVLRRSRVQSVVGTGVSAQSCKHVTIDSSHIKASSDTGILIGSSVKYDIRNSLIAGNATDLNFAVDFGAGSSGTFEFNTVTKNSSGGINCQATNRLSDSIVMGNGIGAPKDQFVGSCKFDGVVIGITDNTTLPTGVIKGAPSFVGTGMKPEDFQLQSVVANNDCCIDKAATGPSTDYFGKMRPVKKANPNTPYDIGFHEVQ